MSQRGQTLTPQFVKDFKKLMGMKTSLTSSEEEIVITPRRKLSLKRESVISSSTLKVEIRSSVSNIIGETMEFLLAIADLIFDYKTKVTCCYFSSNRIGFAL